VGYRRIETNRDQTRGVGGFRGWPGTRKPRSDKTTREEGREARVPGGQ
jgi:hypothetical protein